MSEDIRRSGRANKGHHTKNQEPVDEPSPAPKSKPPPKAEKKKQPKGQTARAQSTQSAEQEEEEEEDAIIRCVCGDQRDIRGRQMICCDTCLAWQHNKCLGLPEGDYWEGKDYYCEQCKPQDHQELLAAMERGEKPWARKKGSKPKARASDVKQDAATEQEKTPQESDTPTQSATQATAKAQTPTPAPVSAQTNDASNGHADAKGNKSQPQSPVGEKRRHEPTAEKANASKKRRKSSHPESKVSTQSAPAGDIEALPQLQKLLAESLRDTLAPLITLASDARGYRIPDGQTAKSLATRIALQISNAALSHCGEPTGRESPYSSKLRAIIFNVKKNAVLVDQLLSGSLKAPDFVAMEAEEMASEDKQREYAAMREAAEKQMILTEEAGPRMRKTHKGEELVGEDNYDNQEFKQPNLRERESVDETAMQSPIANRPPGSPDAARGPLSVDTSGAQTDSGRRPSTNFDINSVFDKVRSPQHDQQAFLQRRQSSMQMHEKPAAPVDDADVDRLLKDEDNDVEMSGYSSDPSVCWQGSISMQSMEPFDAVARFVAGGDFGQVIPWDKLLSTSLSVQGRIESSKGDDYIRGIGHTESHDVAILAVSPVTTEGRAVMDHLYNYFHSRGRWGVVPVDGFGNDVMRDLYVIPIEAGGSNLPPFIDMLEYCTIETPRKEHMMLLALIAKLPEAKPQLPATQHFERYPAQEVVVGQVAQPASTPNHPTNGPSPSPVTNPHGPQFSPVGAAFPQGQYGNPYAQPPANTGPQQLPIPANAPPHHQIPRALEILGPYIDAPVIIQILNSNLSQNQAVSELQMINLRHIVESIPEARTNISVLTDHLRQKSEANGQYQNQPPGN
ncbi:SPOC domain-containing protein [Pyrenochaeta sp. MPI-SDFR-AT-0127]|nr:SPOC domain-containing protein [Pyrenochaeta sp. MPI-SDFR-AT-0127]